MTTEDTRRPEETNPHHANRALPAASAGIERTVAGRST